MTTAGREVEGSMRKIEKVVNVEGGSATEIRE